MPYFETLVVVVYRDRQHFLGAALADDVFIEDLENFMGNGQAAFGIFAAFMDLFTNDVVTQVNALIADEDRRTCDQFSYFMLAFAAKRAIKQLFILILGSFVTHTKLPKIEAHSS